MAETANLQFLADLSEFTSTITDGGDLHWDSGSIDGYAGRLGITIDDTTAIYGTKTGLTTADEYRYRFYISLGTLAMANSDHFRILAVPNDANAIHFLSLQKTAGGILQLAASMYSDGFASENKTAVTWGSWTRLEVHCKRGSAGTGFCKVYADSDLTTPVISITGISNNTVWGTNGGCASFRVGAIIGMDPGTSGTYYLTRLKMRNDATAIGSDSTPPVNTVPSGTTGIFTSSIEYRAVTGMSVTAGTGTITSVIVSVPSGKGTWTFDVTGTSVLLAGNGTNSVLLTTGASTAEYNTVLGTAEFQGASGLHESITVSLNSSDGTLTDLDTFTIRNDLRTMTLSASVANFASLATAVASTRMLLDESYTTGSIRVTATDNGALQDIETVTLGLLGPAITIPAGPFSVLRTATLAIPGISVDFVSSSGNSVNIASPNGVATVTLNGTTVVAGSNGSDYFSLLGTETNINLALDSLTYSCVTKGTQTITITAVDALTPSDIRGFSVLVTNNPPVITSNGGGPTASIDVAEGNTAVTTVTATDIDTTDTLTYAISGGTDAGQFAINGFSGSLTFAAVRDFENPTDSDTDNVYQVIVQVSDGSDVDTQTLTVTVTNVAPTAIATVDKLTGTFGVLSQLRGSASSDPGGSALTYAWTWVTRPVGSVASFSSASAANPTFIPDVGGDYTAQLIVNDGILDSSAVTVTVMVDPTISYAYSDTIPVGAVISSNPASGTPLAPGQLVYLVISLGPLLRPVPWLAEMTQAEAASAITRAGMVAGTSSTSSHDTISVGKIISQSPLAGTKVSAGTTVDLLVSLGPTTVQVPYTLEYPDAQAEDALDQVGF